MKGEEPLGEREQTTGFLKLLIFSFCCAPAADLFGGSQHHPRAHTSTTRRALLPPQCRRPSFIRRGETSFSPPSATYINRLAALCLCVKRGENFHKLFSAVLIYFIPTKQKGKNIKNSGSHLHQVHSSRADTMSAVAAPAAPNAAPSAVSVANDGRSKRKVSKPERFQSPPPAKRFVVASLALSLLLLFFSHAVIILRLFPSHSSRSNPRVCSLTLTPLPQNVTPLTFPPPLDTHAATKSSKRQGETEPSGGICSSSILQERWSPKGVRHSASHHPRRRECRANCSAQSCRLQRHRRRRRCQQR